jgi:uncharacterized Fe-S cluster-containing radical SAM superfamily protein
LQRLGFAVTWRCNLTCTHCLQSDHAALDLDLGLFDRVLSQAKGTGLQVVGLTGGEAALHPDFARIVATIAAHGLHYTLTTNGTLLAPLLEAFCVLPPISMTVSLDGSHAYLHDRIRGPGAFEDAIRTIQVLALAGLQIQIQSTLTTAMLPHLEEMAHLTQELGANRLMLTRPVPSEGIIAQGLYPAYADLLRAQRWTLDRAGADALPVQLSLGADLMRGPDERPGLCSFLRGAEAFVDVQCRLTLCCQAAGVGPNNADVVADLTQTPWPQALAQWRATLARYANLGEGVQQQRCMDHYRCLLCLEAMGKLPPRDTGDAGWDGWWAPPEPRQDEDNTLTDAAGSL